MSFGWFWFFFALGFFLFHSVFLFFVLLNSFFRRGFSLFFGFLRLDFELGFGDSLVSGSRASRCQTFAVGCSQRPKWLYLVFFFVDVRFGFGSLFCLRIFRVLNSCVGFSSFLP